MTPYYNRKNPLLGVRYRAAFCRGYLNLKLVGTSGRYQEKFANQTRDRQGFRGYGALDVLVNINENWRTGLNVKRASDDTFLKRYQFLGYSQDAFLTTRGYAEGFYSRSYFLGEGLYYQSLRSEDRGAIIPYAAPNLEANVKTKPDSYGGSWFFDSSLLNLNRRRGTDTNRLSALGGYQKSWFSHVGLVTDASVSLRADAYHVRNSSLEAAQLQNLSFSSERRLSKSESRTIPVAGLTTRLPFVKVTAPGRFIIEPKAGVVVTSSGKNSVFIPNEDSSGFELSPTNMFLNSRVPGLDRVDDLSRVNYGVNFAFHSTAYGNSSLFLGQTHSLSKVPVELQTSGLSKKTSDYIISGNFNYLNLINLDSSVLLQREDYTARRNESTLRIGPEIFRWAINYTKFQRLTSPSQRPEEISYSFSSHFTERLTLKLSTTRQLGKFGGPLTKGAGLQYTDSCFTLEGSISKNNFSDRDLKPATIFLVSFSFKNLGNYSLNREKKARQNRSLDPKTPKEL